ncbi:hypothetical protein QUB07_17415 [Microcoleus sp. F8-C5]
MKAALRLKLELGVRSQESGVRRKESEGRRKKSEGRSQNKCFYKYEMLPNFPLRSTDFICRIRRRPPCSNLQSRKKDSSGKLGIYSDKR